jgi:hypothetical protein
MAWFVDTRPSGPAPGPAIEAALPVAATTNAAEAEARAAQAKV